MGYMCRPEVEAEVVELRFKELNMSLLL